MSCIQGGSDPHALQKTKCLFHQALGIIIRTVTAGKNTHMPQHKKPKEMSAKSPRFCLSDCSYVTTIQLDPETSENGTEVVSYSSPTVHQLPASQLVLMRVSGYSHFFALDCLSTTLCCCGTS